MIYHLPTVYGRRRGFEHLGRLSAATKDLFADELTLDMSRVKFFDAHMAAPLGAILARVATQLNLVEIASVPNRIEKVLRKNKFLTHFWYEPLADTNNSTMPFRRFRLTDEGAFEEYVRMQLRDRGMPRMSTAASRAFKNKVFEIYQNSVIHSESESGVFVCGQFFPKQHRLDFTVSDTGIGIREAVRRYFRTKKINSVAALKWALKPHHTTKQGPQPGGLGMQFLHEFARLNGGKIQIASRFGFYEYSGGEGRFFRMSRDFPGTTVTIEINTADESTYVLTTETSTDDDC